MSLDFDLKATRIQSNLTQVELSRLSGVSVRQLKALEASPDPNPHPGTSRRLQAALGLSEPLYASLVSALSARTALFASLASALRAQLPSVGYLELFATTEPDSTTLYVVAAVHDASGAQISSDAICEAIDELLSSFSPLPPSRLDSDGTALWLEVATATVLAKSQFLARL